MTPPPPDASRRHTNPLAQLRALGQGVWLDYLRRDFLLQGGLRALIERDGIGGVTSNPTTFAQAIAWTGQYDVAVAEWIRRGETDAHCLYERLAVADIQATADQLRDVFERTDQRDGYVNLAGSPHLAYDAAAIVADAQRLRTVVDRPNLMLTVMATAAGVQAARSLVARGCSVNISLVCGLPTYSAVVEAYIAGLEQRDGELGGIASVASLCVGRIGQAVDRVRATPAPGAGGPLAIAVARVAYQQWKRLHSGRRWTALAARGARPQRLLFTATAAEQAGYPDTLYLEALVGRETIAALPIATLDAFRARGVAEPTLERGIAQATADIEAAAAAGLDLGALGEALVDEGVSGFRADFDTVLAALARKRDEVQLGLPPLNPPRADKS